MELPVEAMLHGHEYQVVELEYVQTRVEGLVTGVDVAPLMVRVIVRTEQDRRGFSSMYPVPPFIP